MEDDKELLQKMKLDKESLNYREQDINLFLFEQKLKQKIEYEM
jgi:hypothetical protein